MRIKKFNTFVNEEYYFFNNHSNKAIENKIKECGLEISEKTTDGDNELYHTHPKNGYEFTISFNNNFNNNDYLIETSYYGSKLNSEVVGYDDIVNHIDKMMLSKPNIEHKYSIDKSKNK